MAKASAARGELPPPEAEDEDGGVPGARDHDGGGVTIDLSELPEERGAKKGGEERRPADDEDDGGLDRAAESADPDLRSRRSEERRTRKKTQKEERDRRERELASRLETTERELAEMKAANQRGNVDNVRETIARLEGEQQRLVRQYEEAKEAKRLAFEKQDGKAAVDADEIMTAARERHAEIGHQKDRIVHEVRAEQSRPRVSPQLDKFARDFMSEHAWYDMKGTDRDSAAVLAIDRKMAAEGWDPNTAGYWEELRERVQDELPHKFGEEEEERETRRDPPRRRQITGGSDRDRGERGGGGNTFFLSAKRVQALKDAGFWEDPEKRARMIRRYKDRDEQDRRQRSQQR